MTIYCNNGGFYIIKKHWKGLNVWQLWVGISELFGYRALDENMVLILDFVRGTRAGASLSGLSRPSRHLKFQPVGTETHSCGCNAGILWAAQVVIELVSGERGVQGFVCFAPCWFRFAYWGDRVGGEGGCISKDGVQTSTHRTSYGSCHLNHFTSVRLVKVWAGHELQQVFLLTRDNIRSWWHSTDLCQDHVGRCLGANRK